MNHMAPEGGFVFPLQAIITRVADELGISSARLLGKERTRVVARPRQVAMYLARELTLHSTPEIGAAFGGRDHTTVLNGFRTVEFWMAKDPLFGTRVRRLLDSFLAEVQEPGMAAIELAEVVRQAIRESIRRAKTISDRSIVGRPGPLKIHLNDLYGERLEATAKGKGGEDVELLVSPKSGSWTLLSTAAGETQVIAAGENWQAVPAS